MKKLILIALVAVTFAACKQKSNETHDSYVITGKLIGLGNDTILLAHRTDDATITDTGIAVSDSFVFTGKSPEPHVYVLKWKHNGTKIGMEFFVENTAINITGNADNSNKIKVIGSPSHDEYDGFLALVRPLDEQMDSLGNAFGKLSASKDKKEIAAIDTAYYILNDKKKNVAADYIAHNKGSHISAFIALRTFGVESPAVGKLDTIYQSLDTIVQKDYYGKLLAHLIASLKLTAVGQPAPAFTTTDTSGNAVSLDSYKGKVVLVDFWASWCGPCRRENPNVVSAYRKFHPKGLEILGVSLDEKRNNWIAAIAKDTLSWRHVSDLKGWNNSVAKLYAVQAIPDNYLIGKDGKILAKALHGDDLSKKLEEVLK